VSARRIAALVRNWTTGVPARRIVFHPLLLTVIAAALIGASGGELVARAGNGDRVAVGNTGGTLSGVIQVDDALIVVGGGNARTDLADLVGRSTVPWHRKIDLLVVPGWDDQQPIGALGLLERGEVVQVVIAGQPADKPVWTALEQQAARDGIPVSIVTGDNTVKVSPHVELEIRAGQPTAAETDPFSVVALLYHASRITFIDASADGIRSMTANNVTLDRTHVLVAIRPATTLQLQSDILLQPRAVSKSDVSDYQASFTGEVRSGHNITIRLKPHEIRLPLDTVTGVSTNTSATPQPTAATVTP
jgi:hypothetical protein